MRKLLIPCTVATLLLSACGSSAVDRATQDPSSDASGSATAAPSPAGYPVDVDSCGETLHFDAPPQKVMIFNGTGLPNLDALGLTDQMALRAGEKNFGIGQEELQAKYDAIQALPSVNIESGGARVETEVILENKVDLVIGFDEGVDREALKKSGVQLYSPAAFCPNYSVEHATWDLIDTETNNLASIFGVQDRAEAVSEQLHKDVTTLQSEQAGTSRGTGIALYITPGQSNFYAYGTSSMVQPIFEANGLKNSYDDTTTRVFDGSMEDILGRNPDWIVLLSLEATPEETIATFKDFPGAEDLQAVVNDKVVVLPFALTDPPTPLSVVGASTLATELANK